MVTATAAEEADAAAGERDGGDGDDPRTLSWQSRGRCRGPRQRWWSSMDSRSRRSQSGTRGASLTRRVVRCSC
uniref:Uncharacterized protein n=1 Tax=Oryza glaberrima TaxID=4538 RepID=I1Q2C8_ORYGL